MHPTTFNLSPWTIAHQAPLPIGVSRQEYWSELPWPPPGDLPNPGVEPGYPTLQADSLASEPPGKPKKCTISDLYLYCGCSRIQPIFNLRAALKSSQETTSLVHIKRFSRVLNGVSLTQEDVIAFPPTVRPLLEVWEANDRSGEPGICMGTFLLQSSSEVSNVNTPENYFLRLFIQNHVYTTLMSHLRDFRDNSLYQLTLLLTSDSNLYVKLSHAL